MTCAGSAGVASVIATNNSSRAASVSTPTESRAPAEGDETMPVGVGPHSSHDDWMSLLVILASMLIFGMILFAAATAGYAGSIFMNYDSLVW